MAFFITGGAGYLGQHIIQNLRGMGQQVTALVLPGDQAAEHLPEGVQILSGDLLNQTDVERFFMEAAKRQATIIHCAAMISIAWKVEERVRRINVEGTRNVVEGCLKHHLRLIHVASVHAIPEKPKGQVMEEVSAFDPRLVVGGYAKTKAEAAALVVDAVFNRGLDAAMVFPSGIIGPGAFAGNSLTQMMREYLRGKLPAGMQGGYNFVDVRDCAQAIASLAMRPDEKGGYLLGGHYLTIRQFFNAIARHAGAGVKPVRLMVPSWLAYLSVPFFTLRYKLKGETPVYTRYAIYTLTRNAEFSNEKARKELGFSPRPMDDTVRDMVVWMREANMV